MTYILCVRADDVNFEMAEFSDIVSALVELALVKNMNDADEFFLIDNERRLITVCS